MSIAATANMLIRDKSWMTPQMKAPLVVSGLFHLAVFLIGTISLPYLSPEMPMPEESISVEILDISEFAQTNKKPAKAEEKKIETPKEEAPEPPPVPVAPKVLAKTPPKPIAPAPPEIAVDAPKEPPPKPAPEPKVKPKIEKKAEAVKEPEEEVKPEEFQGLLRNLMDPPQTKAEASKTMEAGEEPSLMSRFASRMTMSEMDAVRQQLNQCWSVLAGARYAENLVVDIKLFMNPDRTVREARIMDQMRYTHDSYFRAAADSALRAVRSPQCNPLKLPPEKYDLWKEITVRFDPREVL